MFTVRIDGVIVSFHNTYHKAFMKRMECIKRFPLALAEIVQVSESHPYSSCISITPSHYIISDELNIAGGIA